MVLLNLFLYFAFGSLITGRFKDSRFSLVITEVVGFFTYYCLFELVCLPMVLRWQPLSRLSHLWAGIVAAVVILSAVLNWKLWKSKLFELSKFLRTHYQFTFLSAVVVVIELVVIIHAYQFTLDAAFYVAEVTTSLETNMLDIYDPYTGMWMDHFEMRYFFQTYPLNDAVMCYLTGIHPLLWTKTIMEAVCILLSNCVSYLIGKRLFMKKVGTKPSEPSEGQNGFFDMGDYFTPYNKIALFLFFSGMLHFFYTTIYTSSAFYTTRTYEGKALVANVVIPVIFWLYLKLLQDHRKNRYWALLFLVSVGGAVLSNSANMLVPASLFVFGVPLFFQKRDKWILIKTALCMLPGILLIISYVAYVKGYYVLYTYPR